MFISALLSVTFLAFAAADEIVISLNGEKWLLSDGSGRVKDVQANVPGQVHTTLLYVLNTDIHEHACSLNLDPHYSIIHVIHVIVQP